MSDVGVNKWAGDLLDRATVGDFLTSYLVNRYAEADGTVDFETFVLNLNSEWGGGKTFFLNRWKDDLVSQGYPVVYFDAWKTDFSNDPLVAFISAVNDELSGFLEKNKEGNNSKTKKSLARLYKSGKKLIRPSLPLLLAMLTKNSVHEIEELISSYSVNDEAEGEASIEKSGVDSDGEAKNGEVPSKKSVTSLAVSTLVSKAAEEAMKQHQNTKNSIEEFKRNLADLIEGIGAEGRYSLPLFIFVDELDRCRPSYAIELLENIKHLFGVKGVYFVVATDSKQLGHSIKAVYGEGFEANRYLKRFFDQEYNLPEPDLYKYSEFLFEKYGLLKSDKIFSPLEVEKDLDKNVVLFEKMSKHFKMKLRDQEQCCSMLKAIELTWGYETSRIHLGYMLFLIIIKHLYCHDFYEQYVGYEKSGNRRDMVDRFLLETGVNKVDCSVEFSTMKQNSRTFTSSRYSIGINSVYMKYIQLLGKKLSDLHKSDTSGIVVIKCIEESLHLDRGVGLSLLDQYPRIIDQVGQLRVR